MQDLTPSSARGLEDLVGGALARADRAVHVAVPERRGLGAGEVDAPDGRAQRRPERAQPVRAVVGDRAAAGPGLGGPIALDEGLDAACLVAEVAHQVADELVAARRRAAAGVGGGLPPPDEAEPHPRAPPPPPVWRGPPARQRSRTPRPALRPAASCRRSCWPAPPRRRPGR